MKNINFYRNFCKYYLMLEKTFLESIEYVELSENNFNTFSNRYIMMIQSIGAELDMMFKEFCGFTANQGSMKYYADYILENNPDIINQKIRIRDYDIELQPFKNWDVDNKNSLQWWTAFTSIKHNRYDQLKQATQKNVLDILGALYLMEMYCLKEIKKDNSGLDLYSELFFLIDWDYDSINLKDVTLKLDKGGDNN